MMHFLTAIGFLFRPTHAAAQVSDIISGIGGNSGAGQALEIFNTIHGAGRALVVIVSTTMLVRASAKMIGSISEEKMEEGRKSLGTTIMGIILINLTYAFVNIFWGNGSGRIENGAQILNGEILGLVSWIQVIVGVLAVAVLVISGFKAIASFGKDDAWDDLKKAIIGVIVGILLIVFDSVIISAIGADGNASPTAIVHMIISIVRDLLGYLALIAVIMIIYAGVMMIVTLGNEDQYGKSKALIVRVLIGLVIIMFSYFIVSLVSGAIMGTL